MENIIRRLETDLAEPRTRLAADGTDEQLWDNLQAISQVTQQSGEEVSGLMTQIANTLTLAARAAPAAPQTA